MPLTLPRTPLAEARVALDEAVLAENATGHISTPNDVSLITIRHKQLPYSQLITLATLSLYLQLDKLSLTLDFLRVYSGHLLIAQVEDAITSYKGYRAINIEDILTTTELRLSYLQNLNELTFQL